ncbi:TlpA disulfide reductase family protein [Pedobacter sp. ASV1-7]|uniref:TlpA family protein disulfide reductase n=1 Tax=Pedobacter sp. ASV1-7 TaxID=3145237 RepID=UPI0032E88469
MINSVKVTALVLFYHVLFANPLKANTCIQKFSDRPPNKFNLSIHFIDTKEIDSVRMIVWEQYFTGRPIAIFPRKEYTVVGKKGSFNFVISNVPKTFYFTLVDVKGNSIFPIELASGPLLGTTGDIVNCRVSNEKVNFSGANEKLYNFQLLSRKVERELTNAYMGSFSLSVKDVASFARIYEKSSMFQHAIMNAQLAVLSGFEKGFYEDLNLLLKADIIGARLDLISENYRNNVRLYINKQFTEEKDREEARNRLKKLYVQYTVNKLGIEFPDSIMEYSKAYIPYLITKAKIEQLTEVQPDVMTSIKNNYQGSIKDKLIAYYLATNYEQLDNLSSTLDREIEGLTTPRYKSILKKLKTNFSFGSSVYQFTLPNAGGEMVRLSDLKGKIVLIDFWFTGCTACSILYKDILKDIKQLVDTSKVAFVSISTDKQKDQWLRSVESGKYTSPTAINLYTEGKGSDHEVIRQFDVNAFPKLVLIDKNGKLLSNNKQLLNRDFLLKFLRAD